ncbi:MAG: hypothetical protein A2145_01750 [candidate division Zixibacteria bacterium RBG_16_40_9]|nr:MAG: hypothetical protein A2145_01750 [candidate division Zixibacteria bacterium RBG_16_40_9]
MSLKKVEKLGKSLLVWLLGLFIKKETKDKGKIDFTRIKKILLVRQDKRLGNLILTLPLVSALRKRFPQSQISYLADKSFAEVLEMCPEIDEVFVANKNSFWNPLKFWALLNKIRKSHFDLALDLSDENNFSFSNAFLTYLSQAPIRVGYQKAQNKGFLNLEVPIIHKERHVIDRHLDLLRDLMGDFPTPEFNLRIDIENKNWAEDYLARKNVSARDDLIGIHIGGRSKKRWPVENFAGLVKFLTKENNQSIIFWGEKEKGFLSELVKLTENKIIISDLLPITKLAAFIKRCNLFISSDTGPMHLAVALKVPTLSIFIDSDVKKFGPKGDRHRVISGEVGLEQVKVAVKEMLEIPQAILK